MFRNTRSERSAVCLSRCHRQALATPPAGLTTVGARRAPHVPGVRRLFRESAEPITC